MPSTAPARLVPGRRQRRFVLALVVSTMLAVVVPATAGHGSAAAGAPQPSWTACGPRLECAAVPVPLDWRRPDGRRSPCR
jgi:hypothetical protein